MDSVGFGCADPASAFSPPRGSSEIRKEQKQACSHGERERRDPKARRPGPKARRIRRGRDMQGWLSRFTLADVAACLASPSPSPGPSPSRHLSSSSALPRPSPAMKLLPILLAFLALTATSAAADSVTDELEKNGLPVGLLPNSVRSYSIDQNGHFKLSLAAPCYAKIDDQLAFYSQNITGKLKYGTISNLDGIQTKQLFVWLPVTGIYVDVPATPYIYFEVGVLTKRLAVAVFETAIKCSPHVDTGFHLPSWVANGAVGGSKPRKALQ